jgi:hypothetical protein
MFEVTGIGNVRTGRGKQASNDIWILGRGGGASGSSSPAEGSESRDEDVGAHGETSRRWVDS